MAEVDSGPEPAQGSGSSQSTSDYIVTLDGFDRNERVRMQTLLWRAGIVYAPRVSKKTTHILAANPLNVTPSKVRPGAAVARFVAAKVAVSELHRRYFIRIYEASFATKYGIKIVSENFIADRIVKSVESPLKSSESETAFASLDLSRSISPTLGHLAESSELPEQTFMSSFSSSFQHSDQSKRPPTSNIAFGAPPVADNRASIPRFGALAQNQSFQSVPVAPQQQQMQFGSVPPLNLAAPPFSQMYSTQQQHPQYMAPLPSPAGYSQYPPAPMLHHSQMSPLPSPSAPPYHYHMPYAQYHSMPPGDMGYSYPPPMPPVDPRYGYRYPVPQQHPYPYPPAAGMAYPPPPGAAFSPDSSSFSNSLSYLPDYSQYMQRQPYHYRSSPSEIRSPSSLPRPTISSSPRSTSTMSSQQSFGAMYERNNYWSRSPAQGPYPAIPHQMMQGHPLSVQVPPQYYPHLPRSAQQSPTAPAPFPSFSPTSFSYMSQSMIRPSPQPSPLAPPQNPFGSRPGLRQSHELMFPMQPPSGMFPVPPMPLDAAPDIQEYLPRESPPRFVSLPNGAAPRAQQRHEEEEMERQQQVRLQRFLEYARERRVETKVAAQLPQLQSALPRVAAYHRGRQTSPPGSTDDYTSDDEGGDSPSVEETMESSDSDSDVSGTGTVQIHHSESVASSSAGDFSERLTLSPSSVESVPLRKHNASALTASDKRRAKFFRSNPGRNPIPEESESNVDSSDDPPSSPNTSFGKQSRNASFSSDPIPRNVFAPVLARPSPFKQPPLFQPQDQTSQQQQQQHPIIFFNPDSVSPIGRVQPVIPSEGSRPPPTMSEAVESPESTILTKNLPGAPDILTGIEKYEKREKLGEGTYSVVYKVQDRRTGGIYAVKKTKEYGDGISVTSIREVSVLRDCSESKNIVRLHEVCMGVDCVFMVLEYVPFDMGCVLNSIRGHPLPLSYTKTLFQQLLHGIAELHELGYMHRDIKMTNLLLSRDGILKIADLGLARSIKTNIRWEEPDEAKLNSTALKLRHDVESEQEKAPRETPKEVSHRYTSTVVTLWYRAPEVLLGAGRYDEKLDIWSCGCILAEWLLVKPLLPGKSDIDQLERTVRLLGFPNQTAAPNLENVAQKHLLATIPQDITPATCPPTSEVWTGYFGKLDQVTQDFLSVLLSYDPARRPSAREALQHPFFTTAPLPADPRAVADQISSVYKPRKYDK